MSKHTAASLLFLVLLPAAFLTALAGWRVDSLVFLDEEEEMLFSAPLAHGQHFTTAYIHSVERTPVEDEYIVTGGKIWTWQERVKSSNAGMPCLTPENGCYINTAEWMIFQGGRQAWSNYRLRVGDSTFGLNKLTLKPFGSTKLFEIFPGKRLTVTVKTTPLLLAKFRGTEKLYGPRFLLP